MINKILYVTSVTQKLYEISGKYMLQSFVNCQTDGDLLITYEDEQGVDFPNKLRNDVENLSSKTKSKIHLYDLTYDAWLHEWVNNNKDVIPPEYGGTCVAYDNKIKDEWGTNFNRQAARWFRKIVSLNYVINNIYDKHYRKYYDVLVLLDCDVVFKKYLPSSLVLQTLGEYEVFYHLGINRRQRQTGIEAGFMGFRLPSRFLPIVFDCYQTGNYRKYERWDDGYIFRVLLDEHPNIASCDVVRPHIEQCGAHVIPHGPFADYVIHNKGIHNAQGLIVE